MPDLLKRLRECNEAGGASLDRFSVKNWKRNPDGTGNINDFKSSGAKLKTLGMTMVRKATMEQMINFGDRRGWYYEVANVLDGLSSDYKYFGWAEVHIYSKPYIGFYAK